MTVEQLRRLKPLLARYQIKLETSATKILRVNGHAATLDAKDYMPDQLISLCLEIVGADLRRAFFEADHA
ncbi:hypothetical protein [Secundilactobacillus kimchicus]|nr:hypothetical protein [Secundilactobacillus kimchicus]MBT9672059.1 hypothetical protein [Secundilactobacillus kimchicus]